MPDLSDKMLAAKALIPDEDRWLHYGHPGGHCPLTAFYSFDSGELAFDLAKAFAAQIGTTPSGIPRWNNAPERTLAEVHAAFDRAAAALQATQKGKDAL